ncbi:MULTISPECIES: glycosyltransferase family 4 protein [Streptomyces]|uniref:Glycosyltransferase family 4 protein n=1 Tax=Streptomyces sudanensis TaxID=436397 RepID=A0ABY4TJK9_9ACTN|nr:MULTISPECIES: glycosyltransferase family 4 protein [Streptomyces]URN17851.1 glycosyltransferase family 4 protein [Streptomyces sudanensis]
MKQLRTVQVLGGGGAGSGAHVRSLASGLVARGVRVTVCAPAEVDRTHDFMGAGACFVPVPTRGDPLTVGALRAVCSGADLVHAHGLNAAVRSAVALAAQRTPLVVTWHFGPHAEGVGGRLLRLVERKAVRAAAVVLATSPELVDRARRRGARDARLAPVAPPPPHRPADLPGEKARAELGAVGRPLVVTAGPLEPHRGHGTLLDASRRWLGHDPVPLVAVAGEGPRRAALQRRVDAEGLPVRLLGRRDDVAALLAAADVAVLAGRWESRASLAREALRLGVPLVATAADGARGLVGDAAELVPHGDCVRLASAVTRLLTDPVRHAALAAAGPRQAGTWPTEEETLAQVLSVYDELCAPPGPRAPGPRPRTDA